MMSGSKDLSEQASQKVAHVVADWSVAKVIEPLGFVDEDFHTIGAMVICSDMPMILSLHPGEDFELNTDIIHEWKAVFQDSEGEILGDANYTNVLEELHEYIVDQQNGSLLIRALDDETLHEIFARSIFD